MINTIKTHKITFTIFKSHTCSNNNSWKKKNAATIKDEFYYGRRVPSNLKPLRGCLRDSIAMDIERDKGPFAREKWYLSNGNHFIQALVHIEHERRTIRWVWRSVNSTRTIVWRLIKYNERITAITVQIPRPFNTSQCGGRSTVKYIEPLNTNEILSLVGHRNLETHFPHRCHYCRNYNEIMMY